MNFGSPGVTGSACAQCALRGGRPRDRRRHPLPGLHHRVAGRCSATPTARIVSINVHGYDALKHGAIGVVGDAKVTLEKHRRRPRRRALRQGRRQARAPTGTPPWPRPPPRRPKDTNALPSDAQVIGAVQRVATEDTVAMCAAGTMPGALQVLWQAAKGGYHMEYGYSCMGYEIAGAMGIKLADPAKEVICFVGDGSYMMANSELATAVMRRVPFTVVLTDNRGYGCINRLQQECGGAEFNNMYKDSNVEVQPEIDFVAHAAADGRPRREGRRHRRPRGAASSPPAAAPSRR